MHLGPPRKSDPYRRVLGAYQPAVVEVTLTERGTDMAVDWAVCSDLP